MKPQNTYGIILISLFSFFFIGCNDSDDLPNEKEVNDPYMSPSAPKGKIVIMGSGNRRNPYLGAGYDIMGDYLSNSSVKETVFDLSKMLEGDITSIRVTASDAKRYEGIAVKEMLQSIETKNNFKDIPKNVGDLLFTGTINQSTHFPKPYDYSSQYTFVCEEAEITQIKSSISIIAEKYLQRSLSENFKEALGVFTAKRDCRVIWNSRTHYCLSWAQNQEPLPLCGRS